MRVFIAVLVLIFSFQSWTKADDIRDFEIEDMSIGDSLLKVFTDSQIKLWSKADYKSKKYSRISLTLDSYKIYDDVQFHYKTNDKKFIIKSISGGLYFKKDFKKCFKKRDEIVNEIKEFFDNAKMQTKKYIHNADKSGKSIEYKIEFIFNSGSMARVSCMDWSDEITKQHNWQDHLKVGVYDNEFLEWLRHEAH